MLEDHDGDLESSELEKCASWLHRLLAGGLTMRVSAKSLNVAQNAGRLDVPSELQQHAHVEPIPSDVYEHISGGLLNGDNQVQHGEGSPELVENVQNNQGLRNVSLDTLQHGTTTETTESNYILNYISQLREKVDRQRQLLRSARAILSRPKIILTDWMTWNRTIASNEAPEEHAMVPDQREDEEARNNDDLEDPPWNDPGSFRRSQLWLYDKLFGALATAICILNITAGLFYVMLMNDPSPPKWSYKIGCDRLIEDRRLRLTSPQIPDYLDPDISNDVYLRSSDDEQHERVSYQPHLSKLLADVTSQLCKPFDRVFYTGVHCTRSSISFRWRFEFSLECFDRNHRGNVFVALVTQIEPI